MGHSNTFPKTPRMTFIAQKNRRETPEWQNFVSPWKSTRTESFTSTTGLPANALRSLPGSFRASMTGERKLDSALQLPVRGHLAVAPIGHESSLAESAFSLPTRSPNPWQSHHPSQAKKSGSGKEENSDQKQPTWKKQEEFV